MSLTEQITRLLLSARDEERRWRDTLPPEKRAESGTAEAWEPKDVFAHLTAWKAHSLQRIQCALDDDTSPVIEDIDAANEAIFEAYKERDWDIIEAEADQVEEAILERIKRLDHEALTDSERYPWTRGRPLWRLISSDFGHSLLHLSEEYQKIGDRETSSRLVLRMSADQANLSDEPDWQGTVRYNLACYYALSDQAEQAVATLREALQLNPGLSEWSHQDPDLAHLREREDFQAIFNA